MSDEPILTYNSSICQHCFGCIAMCTRGALYLDKDTGALSYNIRKCIRCGSCTRACPSGALQARLRT